VNVISIDDYFMGRDKAYPREWSFDIRDNAELLLKRVNLLLAKFYADTGHPCPAVTSGWRTVEINRRVGGASNSKHLSGEAIDLRDTDNALDEWLLSPPGRMALVECNLYLEHPDNTFGWCHLQCCPPRSGNRVFRP